MIPSTGNLEKENYIKMLRMFNDEILQECKTDFEEYITIINEELEARTVRRSTK